MGKTFQVTVLLYILLSVFFSAVYSSSVKVQTSNLVFQENFDGSTLDLNKWVISQNVNGGTGGSITVTAGSVYLSSSGTSFPCITSRTNPFPQNSDFTVEFDVVYTQLEGRGSGFWVSKGALESHWPVREARSNIFEVWADTTSSMDAFLMGIQVYDSNLSVNTPVSFKLQYSEGNYILSANGLTVASAYSDLRADTIGFGHPALSYIPFSDAGQWSSSRVDSISVFQETSPSPTQEPTTEPTRTPETPSATWIITIAGIVLAIAILVSLTLLLYRTAKPIQKEKKSHLL
jgi:hypothetical protein